MLPRLRAKGGKRKDGMAAAKTVATLSPAAGGKTERAVRERWARNSHRTSHRVRAGHRPREATRCALGGTGGRRQARRTEATAESAGARENRGIRLPWTGRGTTGTLPPRPRAALPELGRPAAGGPGGAGREMGLGVGTHVLTARVRRPKAQDWTGREAGMEAGGRGERETKGERRTNAMCLSRCRPHRRRVLGKWYLSVDPKPRRLRHEP